MFESWNKENCKWYSNRGLQQIILYSNNTKNSNLISKKVFFSNEWNIILIWKIKSSCKDIILVKYGYFAIINSKILENFCVFYLTLLHKQLATQILRERHHELVCPNQYKVYYQNTCNSYFTRKKWCREEKMCDFFAES